MKVLEVDVDTLRDTVMGVGAMAVCMAPLRLYSTEGFRLSKATGVIKHKIQ